MSKSIEILEKLVSQIDNSWEDISNGSMRGAKQALIGEATKFLSQVKQQKIRIVNNGNIEYITIKGETEKEIQDRITGIKMIQGIKVTIIDE